MFSSLKHSPLQQTKRNLLREFDPIDVFTSPFLKKLYLRRYYQMMIRHFFSLFISTLIVFFVYLNIVDIARAEGSRTPKSEFGPRASSKITPDQWWPGADEFIIRAGNAPLTVRFQWPKVTNAKRYYFVIRDMWARTVREATVILPTYTMTFDSPHRFKWTAVPLTSIEDKSSSAHGTAIAKAPPPWIEEAAWHAFEIDPTDNSLKATPIQAETHKNVVGYQAEVVRVYTRTEFGRARLFSDNIPLIQARLGIGAYRVRTRGITGRFANKIETTEWGSSQRLFIIGPAPKLLSPQEGEEVTASDELKSEVTLQWESSPEAERYHVLVVDATGKAIVDQLTNEPRLTIHVHDRSRFRWQVATYYEDEPDRKPAFDSPPRQEFMTGAYSQVKITAAEEPFEFYGWAKQITSVELYQSKAADVGGNVDQKIFGGTSELAGGYWFPGNSFGILAAVSMAGFIIDNTTFFYEGGSILAGTKVGFIGGQRLRLWGGLGYRELPYLKPVSASAVNIDKIQNYGPDLRLSFLDEFGGIYGYHLFASYYGAMGMVETPNGLPQRNSNSYHFGLQGSMRITEWLVGMFGYTYKVESAAFQSIDPAAGDNTIQLGGHYLGVTLLFGK
jgi:hypothetical protein